jgi:hypothetical protein
MEALSDAVVFGEPSHRGYFAPRSRMLRNLCVAVVWRFCREADQRNQANFKATIKTNFATSGTPS